MSFLPLNLNRQALTISVTPDNLERGNRMRKLLIPKFLPLNPRRCGIIPRVRSGFHTSSLRILLSSRNESIFRSGGFRSQRFFFRCLRRATALNRKHKDGSEDRSAVPSVRLSVHWLRVTRIYSGMVETAVCRHSFRIVELFHPDNRPRSVETAAAVRELSKWRKAFVSGLSTFRLAFRNMKKRHHSVLQSL